MQADDGVVPDAAHMEGMVEPFYRRVVYGEELVSCGGGVKVLGEGRDEFFDYGFDLLDSTGRDGERRHG
jgi:hypothetical protein